MNTKEIAKAIGRPVKTVQTWTKLTSAKMASIGDIHENPELING